MTVEQTRRFFSPTLVRLSLGVAAIVALAHGWRGTGVTLVAAGSPCGPTVNPIACENQQPGNPASEWDLGNNADQGIQGFATDISVKRGDTVFFKISTPAPQYAIDVYRLGYYQGNGARKMTAAPIVVAGSVPQAACLTDATSTSAGTGLIDCGNWNVSASWTVPANAVSGVYLAKMTRTDNGGANHIVFIVRDDTSHSDLLFQTSDETWQAYNAYGGHSLYCGGPGINPPSYCPGGRSYKVSYNRPFDTRFHDPQSFVFNAEYPMVRWLEANGFDVSYITGGDVDGRGSLLLNHKVFMSVGHDEYWSGTQRTNVESARDAGVNLAFFSGNEMFWKTRWEAAISADADPDAISRAHRTLVSYKETVNDAKIDPSPLWTGMWRDARFSPPSDGGRPENGLTGTIFTVDCCREDSIVVPAELGKHRFWRNTAVANQAPGTSTTLTQGSLGYEWDEDLDNGARPSNLVRLSSTTLDVSEKFTPPATAPIYVFGSGTATHSLTLYHKNTTDANGVQHNAIVFGAGTVQWSWGLDSNHDHSFSTGGGAGTDLAIQQATINLFADMTVQPGTIIAGLTPASPSTDAFPPTSQITAPGLGASAEVGGRIVISGTASDSGGAVAAVQISADGGATWHPAKGTTQWSYEWSPTTAGAITLRSRAIDDSGNVETPSGGIIVNVAASSCPCSHLWNPATAAPMLVDANDPTPNELGVKFSSDIAGFITGVRFYKAALNTGTHIGNLWDSNGNLLASAIFSGESASGWQDVRFNSAVAIQANTTYIASYHTNVGHYSADAAYFASSGVDSSPLHAPVSAGVVGNGVFFIGPTQFPNSSFHANNYWVDVDFAQSVADNTAATISDVRVTALDASRITVTWRTNEDADSRVDASTVAGFPAGSTLSAVDGTFTQTHSLTLGGLAPNSAYFIQITSIDRAGNAAVALAPSFTTFGPTLRDTVSADFQLGSVGPRGAICSVGDANCVANAYVSETVDGEVILAPTEGSEFSGNSLPAGWIGSKFSSAGTFILAGGTLTVDGARVGTCAANPIGSDCEIGVYGPGHSLEFVATFTGDMFQHAGFGVKLDDGSEPWALFSTGGVGSQLYARTNPGSNSHDILLGTSMLGSPHRYRIDWSPASVDYYIDGALVASDPIAITQQMRPIAASDLNAFGGNIVVNWTRMSPYAASGSFLSRVFDAQNAAGVDWATIKWSGTAPAGTTAKVSVRTGPSATPTDGTWSSFVQVAGNGALPAGLPTHSRYVQYRVDMTTTNAAVTPSVDDVLITTDQAPHAVDDVATTPINTAKLFPASGPSSLKANDTDNDTAAAQLRIVAVSSAAHGAVVLSAGAVTYTPAIGFSGIDTFTYTLSDGLLSSTATVTMNVGVAPIATGDSYSVKENAVLNVASGSITANDSSIGPVTAVLVAGPGHGTLVLNGDGSFTYTPTTNFFGADSFTYQDVDGSGLVSNSAVVNISVLFVNQTPSFTAGPSQALLGLPGAQTVANWARNVSAGPSGESSQLLNFIVSNNNNALFTVQPAVAPNGTLTYTPSGAIGSALVSVQLHDDGGTDNGGIDTSAPQTFTISVAAASTTTSVVSSVNPSVSGGSVKFTATVAVVAPGVGAPAGTVTFKDGAATLGTGSLVGNLATFTTSALSVATHSITAVYGGNTNFLGSSSATLSQVVGRANAAIAVTTSNSPSLFGVPITLTATIAPVAPATGVPSGSITFKDGSTALTIGTATLVGNAAKITTSSLGVGTHSITAVYSGDVNFASGTSPALSQVISPSAMLRITFTAHTLMDNTSKPKVQDGPVANSLVRVYTRGDACTNGVIVSGQPKLWGTVFDGLDGPGGTDPGCPVVSVGSYRAEGTTDANGRVSIIVPPTSNSPNTDYIVIGKADGFDYLGTGVAPDPLYSEKTVQNIAATVLKDITLHQLRLFNGKRVAGKDLEEYGTYLAIVQPDFMDWDSSVELYPFVMVADGTWDVTTSLTPPEGFVADSPTLSTSVTDATTAIQFTLTDVGSSWTATTVNHTIVHKGTTRLRGDQVPMFNKQRAKARGDKVGVAPDSGPNTLDVLANDRPGHSASVVTISSVGSASNGSVQISRDGLSLVYTPAAGYSGIDSFTYSITDDLGGTDTATVVVVVGTAKGKK